MKDSGVEWIGEIPKNKKIIRNKYMFKYEKGKLPSNTNTEKIGVPYIGASDLDSNTDEYVNYTEDETLPDAKIDDLLVLWDGARAGLAGTKKCGKISSTIVKISADDTVYTSFLYWYYKGFEKYMSDSVTGTTIPHMNRKYIEDIQFIDWGIDEQKKMTEYLDEKCAKIDAIIEKQQEIIEKLKEYKLSIISEAVTKGLDPDVKMKDSGIDWIKKIPDTWTSAKLSKCISTDKGFAFKSDTFKANGIPVVRVSEMKEGTVLKPEMHVEKIEPEYEKVILHTGDILMTTVGSHPRIVNSAVGQLARLPIELDGALLNQNAVCLRTKEGMHKDYMYYFLSIKRYREHLNLIAHGTANQYSISLSEVLDFTVVVPKYNEQVKIADYLNEKCIDIEKTITERNEAISKLQEYKKSLIYEVVTGKREV